MASCSNNFTSISEGYKEELFLTKKSDTMKFFFGNLHSHSAYSDGIGTPSQIYHWARHKAKLDFYGITDHGHQLSVNEWNDIKNKSYDHTQDNHFVALHGFEWTSFFGHICIWNSNSFTTAKINRNLLSLYIWLRRNNAIAQFNHPGREKLLFKNFALNNSAFNQIIAIETGNKNNGNIHDEYLKYYSRALQKGWRLGPTNNQDNHRLKINSHRTVIIAQRLTKKSLLDALKARRFYSSDDPNIEVTFKINNHWMGDVIKPRNKNITFTIKIEDDEAINSIYILDKKDRIIDALFPQKTPQSVTWNPTISLRENNFFYLKVYSQDSKGDEKDSREQLTVTAPIWVLGK